jgi:hypothetical protein
MLIEKLEYIDGSWRLEKKNLDGIAPDIVFVFGKRLGIQDRVIYRGLRKLYPYADIVGCSSSGNIFNDRVSNASVIASAIYFEMGSVRISIRDFSEYEDQIKTSKELILALPKDNLKHIFILVDGLNINGSKLIEGANMVAPSSISITGGLAGDDENFIESIVMINGVAKSNRAIAVGFYGESIKIRSGCFSGWSEFGILRKITKSKGNIVYEIDGKPALDLYKRYLGDYAKELPKSALNFPISIKRTRDDSRNIIRTVLGIDEKSKSLIFAGDVPVNYYAKLMKASVDGLIDGAMEASKQIGDIDSKRALGMVVSCVGRKLVLNQLVDEELEAIKEVLGDSVDLVGFYSYGELAPFKNSNFCELHNQTMTITLIYEK